MVDCGMLGFPRSSASGSPAAATSMKTRKLEQMTSGMEMASRRRMNPPIGYWAEALRPHSSTSQNGVSVVVLSVMLRYLSEKAMKVGFWYSGMLGRSVHMASSAWLRRTVRLVKSTSANDFLTRSSTAGSEYLPQLEELPVWYLCSAVLAGQVVQTQR